MKQQSSFLARSSTYLALSLASGLTVTTLHAAPSIDGSIGGAEGWTLLTENPDAAPIPGGSPTQSDLTGETSGFHYWSGADNAFNTQRGGVDNLYWSWDSTSLYLAVLGGSAPFNSWIDPGGNNDQGDLYVAIETDNSGAQLNANSGHTSYGVKAVDFQGWRPDYVVGVQFVDNGGGGGGGANIEKTVGGGVLAGEGQGLSDGGFDWDAGFGARANYELAVPWSVLGFGSAPIGTPLKLAMYMTQNPEGWDTYDSGPGIGNLSNHEELGDRPGDLDEDGSGTLFLGASDFGSIPAGAFPGANLVAAGGPNDFNLVRHTDEIDTIEEYYVVIIPEPSSATLATLAVLSLLGANRWRRSRQL